MDYETAERCGLAAAFYYGMCYPDWSAKEVQADLEGAHPDLVIPESQTFITFLVGQMRSIIPLLLKGLVSLADQRLWLSRHAGLGEDEKELISAKSDRVCRAD